MRGGSRGRRIGYLLVALTPFALRLALAPFTEDPWDLAVWRNTGLRMLAGQSPYDAASALPYAYPPPWAFWCAAAAALGRSAPPAIWRLLLKLPLIAADAALALLCLRIGARASADGRRAAWATAWSPLLIAVSALWGQFDSLPAFLFVLGLHETGQRRLARGGLCLGAATVWKGLYPALLFPWIVWRCAREWGPRGAARLVAGIAVPVLIALAPLLAWDPHPALADFRFHLTRPPQGLNLWAFLIFALRHSAWRNTIGTIAGITMPAAVAGGTIWLGWKSRRGEPARDLTLGSVFLVSLFLLTNKVVNEQYLIWLAAPLAAAWALGVPARRWAWSLSFVGAAAIAIHVGPDLLQPVHPTAMRWSAGAAFPDLYRLLGWMALGFSIFFGAIATWAWRRLREASPRTVL